MEEALKEINFRLTRLEAHLEAMEFLTCQLAALLPSAEVELPHLPTGLATYLLNSQKTEEHVQLATRMGYQIVGRSLAVRQTILLREAEALGPLLDGLARDGGLQPQEPHQT